jgi:signal peptidase I
MTVIRVKTSFSLTTLTRRFSLPFAVVVVVLLLIAFVDVVRVSGNSMNPTLQDGQLLLNFKHLLNYQHGDVVILRPPPELQTRAPRFVKRLIAIAGDTISIRDNKVYLNDQVSSEPYVLESFTRAENFPEVLVYKAEVVAFEGFALAELPEYLKDTLAMLEPLPQEILEQSQHENVSYIGTIKLSKEFYFVLGDNRGFSASEDSRLFGAIPRRDLLGMVSTLGMKKVKKE